LPLKSYQNSGGSSATAPGSPLDSVKAPVALTSVQGHALKSDSGGTMVRREQTVADVLAMMFDLQIDRWPAYASDLLSGDLTLRTIFLEENNRRSRPTPYIHIVGL